MLTAWNTISSGAPECTQKFNGETTSTTDMAMKRKLALVLVILNERVLLMSHKDC
jgi:hypothetical protein